MENFDFMSNLSFKSELWLYILPCSLMLIDFVTGFLNAWLQRRVKSYMMRRGLAKKVGEITVLLIGGLFTFALGLPPYILISLSAYIIIMELISICENLNKLDVPIPKWIIKALGDMEEKIQNGNDEEKNQDKTNKEERDE